MKGYKKIVQIANEITGSEGDHNSREFARGLIMILGEAPIKEYKKVWKTVKSIFKKYNPDIYLKEKGGE